MPSKIIFLGTAGDSFVLSKLQRTAAGIIIEHDETQIHINPGPNSLLRANLSGIDSRKTKVVIITDNTLLHAHDANAVIDAMTIGGFDRNGLLLAPKPALNGTRADPASIFPFYQASVEKVVQISDGNKVNYNNIQIIAVKIKNSDPDAIGLKIITPSFSLGYTSKTKYASLVRESFKGVEILILELPLFALKKSEDGLSLAEAERLISEVKPKVAVLTGFGIEILKQDILEITRNMNRRTNIQIIAANDGFSFDPTSYAVKLRQKRLSF